MLNIWRKTKRTSWLFLCLSGGETWEKAHSIHWFITVHHHFPTFSMQIVILEVQYTIQYYSQNLRQSLIFGVVEPHEGYTSIDHNWSIFCMNRAGQAHIACWTASRGPTVAFCRTTPPRRQREIPWPARRRWCYWARPGREGNKGRCAACFLSYL